MRSPQIEQVLPLMGRMDDKQSRHTGRREMLVRGAPHKRQSEGNSVANRLSAIAVEERARREAKELRCSADLALEARIGSPLLLKTVLPARPVPHRSQPDELETSIAAQLVPAQRIGKYLRNHAGIAL